MSSSRDIRQTIEDVVEELENNPQLAERLRDVLKPATQRKATTGKKSSRRRSPGAFDPFAAYSEGGENGLRSRLSELDVEQLKDMVAEHGMDQSKLAMKWRTDKRLIDLIVKTVGTRSRKGDAFRSR